MHSAPPKPIEPTRKKAQDEDRTKQLEEEAREKDEKRKAYFSKGSEIVASFEKAEQEYSELIKGKLIAKARGKPCADHSFTNEVVFEHTFLHLILSDYLDAEDLARLNP